MEGKLFAFRILKHSDPKTATRFCRALCGYKDRSNNGVYSYKRSGLLDQIPHVKLIRGVLIVNKRDAKKLKDFLESYGAGYYVRKVTLTSDDVKALH